MRHILETILGRAGYQVTLAVDGLDALERVESEPFDLVITDLALPKASGLQVIKRVRKKGCCPVIGMSAHWQTSRLLEEAEALGCEAVLAKPFDQAQLKSLIERHVRKAEG